MGRDANAAASALAAWRDVLAETQILDADRARACYGSSTEGVARRISGALLPRNEAEVARIVRIARDLRVALYPISTGHNWGYGSSSPARDDCVLLDLARLDRVVELDADLGIVTLEPGVTQQALADHLDERGLEFLVPVTGAGPSCSLIGNALERGYGITPHADHFAAVTAIRAVLPSGEIYSSALAELGGVCADRAHKWGLGPYVDGLFAQGNFGVVTQASIVLARRPERMEAFLFGVRSDGELERAIEAVRGILVSVGGIVGSVNLMSPHRMLASLVPYPFERCAPNGTLPEAVVAALAREHRVFAWTGLGALYGTHAVVRAARREVEARLARASVGLRFVNTGTGRLLHRLASLIPTRSASRLSGRLQVLDEVLKILAGRPSEISMGLAYWKLDGARPSAGLNPARDGCGLLWYAPLVPMKANTVRAFVECVREVCAGHGMEPVVTLTSLSDRCFDATVPLLFRRDVPEEHARAHACWRALFDRGRSLGCIPYRIGTPFMEPLVAAGTPFWRLVGELKRAVDPHGIIAPGRYAPDAG